MIDHIIQELSLIRTIDIIGPIIGAFVFITFMSLLTEPTRQNFNAILVAGAGSAYLNGGLGLWEFPYIAAATLVAYKGLSAFRILALPG